MQGVTDADKASTYTDSILGERGEASMPTLLRSRVRSIALECDGRAETTDDLRSDRGTSGSLLGSPARSDEGIRGVISQEVGQRWMSFAGIKVAQILADYWMWEAVLNERKATGIIELGSGTGGFSLYLSAQAEARDMFFRTYDIFRPERRIPGFVQLDIFALAEDIGSHLQRHDPVILFCDGGNKPRELKTFSRYLSPDSTIIVHDWGTEMLESDVPDNVKEIYGSMCDEIGSMSRCFQVVVDD